MKIYALQIHNSSTEDLDRNYLFASFWNMCRSFEEQFIALATDCKDIICKDYPKMEGSGEVTGGFSLVNANGSVTIAKCYDYHLIDED